MKVASVASRYRGGLVRGDDGIVLVVGLAQDLLVLRVLASKLALHKGKEPAPFRAPDTSRAQYTQDPAIPGAKAHLTPKYTWTLI